MREFCTSFFKKFNSKIDFYSRKINHYFLSFTILSIDFNIFIKNI